jgi:Uma2 family endonuclease
MTLAEAPPRTTPEQLLNLPNQAVLELVESVLVEKNVSIESSRIEGQAYNLLSHAAESGNFVVFPASLGYRCFPDDPDKVRRPDVTVIRGQRLRELGGEDRGYMPIVPDLAVEVVSRHDTVYEVTEKVREYLAAGFGLVWVMNPESRTVEVHAAGEKPVLLSADDEITAKTALPGFGCKVAELFG